MRIIILGAGHVGSSLAKNLQKQHDITIIDTDPEKLRYIQTHYDVQTVCGIASHPDKLEAANAKDADLLIAVTNNDEVNIVACQIAYSLFKIPKKIARLRTKSYTRYAQIFNRDDIPIDFIINPAEFVTQMLVRLIENPGSFQVVDFANNRLQIAGAQVAETSNLIGMSLAEFRRELPGVDARIMGIYRDGNSLDLSDKTRLAAFDDVFFITERTNLSIVLAEFCPDQTQFKSIFIAGGGKIGTALAQRLEKKYTVKLIEKNPDHCHHAAEILEESIVLSGDAADNELLDPENIDQADLFCAVTNDDEANIMSAMLAKRLGAKKTIALINSLSYAELVNETQTIDHGISPHRITIGVIQTYLRKGEMLNIYSLYGGRCEAMEIVVHGNPQSSPIVGKKIKQINLPPSVRIGAIIRNNKVMIAHDEHTIVKKDRIVIVITDLKQTAIIEKLFQVLPVYL